ncbi:uncharacterized protein EV422DRAFT_520128 [Fimicolochytrium jonesii]|uniref:uncharacterized protein n=1 Tax=Fimicolochytrium jonesii TaxID=1396493 RepID=UPI0022FE0588|nr:uncharacterized protein EV422DRAFT_520128 [Fimicolochytrium jonesii]KAI8824447.1 hypothetical protein EV422DRAFT_520128 [Fimicolochytrium jonesii]
MEDMSPKQRVHPEMAHVPLPSLWAQLKALLNRNRLIKMRNRPQLIAELTVPMIFIFSIMSLRIDSGAQTFAAVNDFPLVPSIPGPVGPDAAPLAQSSILAYTAPSADTDAVIAATIQDLNAARQSFPQISPSIGPFQPLTSRAFLSETDLEKFYFQNPESFFAGIVFDSSITSYTLRLNTSVLPNAKSVTASPGACRDPTLMRFGCEMDKYLRTGFLSLQGALDQAISNRLLSSNVSVSNYFQQMPIAESTEQSTIAGATNVMIPLYLTIAFFQFYISVLFYVVQEKEKRIKELVYIMGLRPLAFWLSWGITYAFGIIPPVVIIVTAIVKGISFLPNTSFLLILIIFYLYCISTVALAFATSPFFSKTMLANVVGPFVTIIPAVLQIALQDTQLSSGAQVIIAMVLSPLGHTLLLNTVVKLEINGSGMQWSSIPWNGAGTYLLGLALSTPFYALLAMYLDAVVKQEFGVTRPWYFPLTMFSRKANSKGALESHTRHQDNPDDMEPDESGAGVAVEITGLRRIFGESSRFTGKSKPKVAVDNLNLHMNSGEIFGILGHNGAGKTTTIHMLCGLIPPTEGTATIYGLDIRKDMPQIRQLLGVTPQHDCLFDKLTVVEHLRCFAGIKGITGEERDTRVEEVLREVHLDEKRNTFAEGLSGGEKRKLSVGIAILARPKLLILDEPTSGMDPLSRRQLWDLLSAGKPDRCTLLSTHFMDEADVLADRKAILSHGQVQCLGTSMFLKKRFGIGYQLDIVHAPNVQESIDEVVKHQIPTAKFTDEDLNPYGGDNSSSHAGPASNTIVSKWELPAEHVARFPALLKILDGAASGQATNGPRIESYGLSMPTLEQVFLKSAELDEAEIPNAKSGSATTVINVRASSKEALLPRPKANDIRPLSFWGHVITVAKLRYLLEFRQKRKLFFAVGLPIVMLLVGLVLRTGGNETSASTSTRTFIISSDSGTLFYDAVGSNATDGVAIANVIKPTPAVDNDAGMNRPQWVLNNQPHIGGFQLGSAGASNYLATIFFNGTGDVDTIPKLANTVHNAILAQRFAAAGRTTDVPQIKASLEPLTNVYEKVWDTRAFVSTMLIGFAFGYSAAGHAIALVLERQERIVHQLYVMGLPRAAYWAGTFLVDWSVFMILPVVIIIFIFALPIANFGGAAFPIVFLGLMVGLPSALLFSYALSLVFTNIETARNVMSGIISPMVLIPYLLVTLISNENTAKTLHYVFATVDPYYPVVGILYHVNMLSLINSVVPGMPALTVADYFAFDAVAFPTLLIALVQLGVASMVIYYLDFQKTRFTESSIKPWNSADMDQLRAKREGRGPDAEADDEDVIKERRRVQDQLEVLSASKTVTDLETGDSSTDVDSVLVANVRKTYPAQKTRKWWEKSALETVRPAVDWSSWGVSQGEVFGLLGPNGAGKTSTLSIAVGAIAPTHGNVYVQGRSIFARNSDAYKHIGFDPQFDALWPDLTPMEHLKLYGTLKGMQEDACLARIDTLLKVLDIEEFRTVHSGNLSGGNRRKLSFAIAISGEPDVLFLDEPSTGIDPSARRRLWDILLGTKDRRATVLTTHSMEEADILSTKIGIQVAGRLRCFGTAQHLKSKFGEGYQLEVQTHGASAAAARSSASPAQNATDDAIVSVFPNAALVDHFATMRRYRVPVSDFASNATAEQAPKVSGLGGAFEALEELRATRTSNIKNYAFSQTTLDQVFIDFAKGSQVAS